MFGNQTYLVLLLVWIAPIIALHWWIGGDILRRRWKQVVIPTLFAGLYLAAADRIAIGDGIWEITAATSVPLKVFGLPFEELLFFLVTALVVSQSITLMIDPALTIPTVGQRFGSGLSRLPGRLPDALLAMAIAAGWSTVVAVVLSLTGTPAIFVVPYAILAVLLAGLVRMSRVNLVVFGAAGIPLLLLWGAEWLPLPVAVLLAVVPYAIPGFLFLRGNPRRRAALAA